MNQSKKGFTIIEVVIVLAIAGLIFAIVFWALPNLQKNQRDNERRTVVGNMQANLDQYAANTNGNYPDDTDSWNEFLDAFYACNLNSTAGDALVDGSSGTCNLEDPLEGPFLTSVQTRASSDTDVTTVQSSDPIGTLVLVEAGQCDIDNGIGQTAYGGVRGVALMVKLENGLAYCSDNQ